MMNNIVNSLHFTEENVKKLSTEYYECEQYPHLIISDFLNKSFLDSLQEGLFNEEWFLKNNDLYKFLQSKDLNLSDNEHIKNLKKFLYSSSMRDFIKKITGIEVFEHVDLSASNYAEGCHLLCHDDELDNRRIAFIIYLVPEDWSQEDGGALDLYAVDEEQRPQSVFKSILPKRNNFAFFSVTSTSFHQVAEIMSSKERLAVSGWYYGASIIRSPPPSEPQLPRIILSESNSCVLKDWINPIYFDKKNITRINKKFSRESVIQLNNFLRKEKLQQIKNRFQDGTAKDTKQLEWKSIGPADRRNYKTLGKWNSYNTADIVKEAMDLFISPEFANWIQSISCLNVEAGSVECRSFSHGDYTLVQDNEEQHGECGLDAYMFFCGENKWETECGGQVTYIDEEEELASFVPTDNAFCLAYRDVGCMKYVKYIDHRAPESRQEFSVVYWCEDDMQ